MIASLIPFAGKALSEMLLSLYPVFVKNINMPLPQQMWSRFVAYVGIALFFIDVDFIKKHMFSLWGLVLAAVTLVHIYTSYQGFMELESGTAFTLFYTYPVLILLFAKKLSVWLFAGAVLGVLLLAQKSSPFGLLMIAGAAITEAIIYFIILKLPSKNSWNHLFLSYFVGALLLSAFYRPSTVSNSTMVSLGINSIIGMFGYVLRFYAVSRLPVFWYALLSNLGVAFSYFYGYVFNGEIASVRQILGTAIVLLTCWFAK